ncbi:Polyadenylate-binding protein (RRM superfamily), partial [Pseudoloma neurophilia]
PLAMTKLFVSNLPLASTIKEIQDLFLVFGPLKSIKQHFNELKENDQTQNVFVEYYNESDAEKAINSLKGQKIMNRPILIEKAFERFNKLYVGKLPPTITVEDLKNHFRSFGEIISIQREPENDFAFIVFKDQEIVELLIKSHSKQNIRDVKFDVKRAFSRKEVQQRIIPPKRSIIIKNVPTDIKEKDFQTFFKDIGLIERVHLQKSQATVIFYNEFAALKA